MIDDARLRFSGGGPMDGHLVADFVKVPGAANTLLISDNGRAHRYVRHVDDSGELAYLWKGYVSPDTISEPLY